MAEHHATITVHAPVHQVYQLFTHFNDFPKFMSFVKEVTYYDDKTSHWVAEVAGSHEWDAANQNWIEDRQIGWISTKGLKNSGRVTFSATAPDQTLIGVFIDYDPPAGILGEIGENLVVGSRFDAVLQHDLDHFAEMVRQAPPGALDPMSSNYIFHADSAAVKGTTTERQNATMTEDSTTERDTTVRPILDRDIIGEDLLPSELAARVPMPFPDPNDASDLVGLPDPTRREPYEP